MTPSERRLLRAGWTCTDRCGYLSRWTHPEHGEVYRPGKRGTHWRIVPRGFVVPTMTARTLGAAADLAREWTADNRPRTALTDAPARATLAPTTADAATAGGARTPSGRLGATSSTLEVP